MALPVACLALLALASRMAASATSAELSCSTLHPERCLPRDHVLLQLPAPYNRSRAELLVTDSEDEKAASFCCFSAKDSNDFCGTCWPSSTTTTGFCAASKERCLSCSSTAKWCESSGSASSTTGPSTTKAATTKVVTQPPVTTPRPPSTWTKATWTTGYWDCCKPSCSWPNKGKVSKPAAACDVTTGNKIADAYEASACDGGKAASCKDYQPKVISASLSMGFAAAAVSGSHGLTGDANCGQCFELRFIDTIHQDGNWGGSHPKLVGKTMVVQVNNIGYDVTGEHSFDLQIPGAGQGKMATGCVRQYPGKTIGDFDCDNRWGGCNTLDGCSRLPAELQAGCAWRYNWYYWLQQNGQTNNPYVDFRRIKCPTQLTDISGSIPLDDDQFPSINIADYP